MRKAHDCVDGAPAEFGPHPTAATVGYLLYTSGQLPNNSATGNLVGDTVVRQAKQTLEI